MRSVTALILAVTVRLVVVTVCLDAVTTILVAVTAILIAVTACLVEDESHGVVPPVVAALAPAVVREASACSLPCSNRSLS